MRPITLLGISVFVFAAIALFVGARAGDVDTLLIGGVAVLCGLATLRAAAISTFLRILIAIFSTELILSGLVYLVVASGNWPAGFEDYQITESLPITLGIFAILTYAVSHIPVVGRMMRIADGYFESPEVGVARIWPLPAFQTRDRRLAAAMIVALVLINQIEVGINVRLSFFNRAWFNAIQEKNADQFWSQLYYVFAPWAAIFIAFYLAEYIIKSTLIIRWRQWLTNHYISRWLDGVTHYRMSLSGASADNPDQRIAEDVNRFIDGGDLGYGVYSYSILLISTVSSLVSFAIILWKLSDNFAIPGTDIILPGFLFWVALVYAAIGTLVTHLIGRPLVRLFFLKQRYEATFRFGLARIREYNEQVALLAGEAAERRESMRRFGDIYANYIDIIARQKRLIAFQSFYGQISPIIPYVFAAPFYFAGKVELGMMTQTAGAFGSVGDGLNFFVTYYRSLAEFKSVLDRLTSFDEAIAHAHAPPAQQVERQTAPNGAVHISGLALNTPDGHTIVEAPDLTIEPHRSLLLTGPSGSGKSTLFRAMAGIWPFGAGRIAIPAGARLMVLPQKPYIPSGDLRTAVAYPSSADAFSDAQIKQALTSARLGDFVNKIDEEDNWSQRLSGGEQQRLAIARALLAKPDWLLLDEATASLDAENELALYRTLFAQLPQATIVSIAHHAGLTALHDRVVALEKTPSGTFAPRVEAAPTA